MNELTPTPRTDKALEDRHEPECGLLWGDFARTLERELITERAAREQAEAMMIEWRECASALRKHVRDNPLHFVSIREARLRFDNLLTSTTPPPILAERDALRAENRKLADTVIGWSRLVERDGQLRAIEALRGTHDCGCEVCSRTSTLCPATASSYALRIIELESALAALKAELERLRAEVLSLNSESEQSSYVLIATRLHAAKVADDAIKAMRGESVENNCNLVNEAKALKLKLEVAKGAFERLDNTFSYDVCKSIVRQALSQLNESKL